MFIHFYLVYDRHFLNHTVSFLVLFCAPFDHVTALLAWQLSSSLDSSASAGTDLSPD